MVVLDGNYKTLGDLIKTPSGEVVIDSKASGKMIAGAGTLINEEFISKFALEEGTHYDKVERKKVKKQTVSEFTINQNGDIVYKDKIYRKPREEGYVSPLKAENKALKAENKALQEENEALKLELSTLKELQSKETNEEESDKEVVDETGVNSTTKEEAKAEDTKVEPAKVDKDSKKGDK